jgi:hypothetical protein
MNKRYSILISFAVVSVVILSIYIFQYYNTSEENEEVISDPVSEVSSDESVDSEFTEYLEKKKKYKIENKDQVDKESREYWNRMAKIAEGRKKEIHFFGRVIDQNDNPVSGAEVLYSAKSGFLVQGDGRSKIETNSFGVFEIKNVFGTGLQIISISKLGFKVDINGFKVGGRAYSNYKKFENSKLWSEHNTLGNAAVFKSWKLEGGYPNTSYVRHGGYLDFGRTYSYDFSSKKDKVKKQGQSKNWDFQITFDRAEFDWKLTFVVPNGGIIEQDSSVNLFEAPVSGNYQSVYEVAGQRGGSEVVRSFYIYTRGYYGKMTLEISPNRSDQGFIRFESVVNLDKEPSLFRR